MLRCTVKTKYALIALFHMALEGEDALHRMSVIAGKEGIPRHYLEQVLLTLKKAKLVESERGAQGGYRLKKPAASITVSDIMEVMEGQDGFAHSVCGCDTLHHFWVKKDQEINDLFQVSLETLVRDQHKGKRVLQYSI